jgi:homogentisate 1,2-dioxygenase
LTHYRAVGDIPPKRHTVHTGADGRRHPEELFGLEGFSAESSLLYHRASPSALCSIEAIDDTPRCVRPNHPLAPWHLRTGELAVGGNTVLDRRVLLGNDDIVMAWAAATETSPLYRNAAGAELVFVQAGTARVESSFGVLAVGAGDYVVIPRGTTHRWAVPEGGRVDCLILEAAGHVRVPRHYLSERGQMLERAPYAERDQRAPEVLVEGDTETSVVVRTKAGLTRFEHETPVLDVVGWDGCVYPWALSIHDFEPVVGSLHQPPPVHQTFEGPGFVVCSFVPRPFDFHPDAVKVPYHHANADSDEVLFYAAGDFMSRSGSGIAAGSLSMHPGGFVHGPQPGSYEASVDATRTEETAVMIDTFRPLGLGPAADAIADPSYPTSWHTR